MAVGREPLNTLLLQSMYCSNAMLARDDGRDPLSELSFNERVTSEDNPPRSGNDPKWHRR
jgi:hypothetical protein